MKLLTQEQLRDLFIELTGNRASTGTIKACIIEGMPYIYINKRKLFNKDSVLEWLKKKEIQSPYYINKTKHGR